MSEFSIITATYNSEKTLEACLSSVASQEEEVEHILVDGGSRDKTLEIANRHLSLSKVISEPDDGVYDGMNKGIRASTGRIIGILNSDDFYPSADVLTRVRAAFESPLIDACYGDLNYVDSKNASKIVRVWRAGQYSVKKFYNGWMPPHPTFFVRRSAYEKFGAFSLDMGTAADYELMLRFLLVHKLNAAYIPGFLVHMRNDGMSNISIGNRLKANRMDRKAWKINNLKPYPWTLAFKPLRKIAQWYAH